CRGCVLSKWGCNWCVHQHSCTHKPMCEEGVIIYNQHFKLPTSSPPTTKTRKVISTSATTAAAATTLTMTTATTLFTTTSSSTATTTSLVPVTTVTSRELTTSAPHSTAARPEPATCYLTMPPQPSSTAVRPDLSSNSQSYTAAVELVIVTQSKSEEPTVMPNVAVAAAELLPITGADGLSGDQEPVMPLIISDSSTLKVVTMSPSRDTQEAEETLNMAEPPTLASPDAPVPTSVSVREPAVTEPSVNLDLTHIPTLSKAGAPGTDPDLTMKSKQVDKLPEDAALAEEDTTTLSAPTVLSGDGEDHDPPSYAHLRETDSDPELVSQYDSADAFLP
ncbi:hypothetical protein XENOCAPTIV_009261, partial [Xenoophorus captivus]